MHSQDNQPQRFHSLDNLRAIMMWLGIVLHVSANHLVGKPPLPFVDSATSVYANLAMIFIHSFRMPVFFMLSGFFSGLLINRRGVGGMLKNRLRRLGLPLLVFGPPVFVSIGLVALVYVHVMINGTVGIDLGLLKPDPNRPKINLMHMWFIYYLLLYSLCAALAGKICTRVPESARRAVMRLGVNMGVTSPSFFILLVPLIAITSFYKAGLIRTNDSLIPDWPAFAYNGIFFVCGLFLYWNQQALFAIYAKRCWQYTIAGALLFMAFMALFNATGHHFENFSIERNSQGTSIIQAGLAMLYASVSVIWSIALIGIFVRYFSHQSRLLRYISESSYWVYLVHMIGTIGFGIVLYATPLSALVKMGINILATSVTSLLSYHLLVRFTVVGLILNGQRHVRQTPKVLESVT